MAIDLAKLFQAHGKELQGYLRQKLRDTDTAAELTQETFVRFAQQLKLAEPPVITHTRSYLYRTAHNLAIDHLRRQQREQTDVMSQEQLDSLCDDSPDLERKLGGQQQLQQIERAMTELPELTQQVFRLTRLEGLTYKQAAKQLGISDSSVQKHLSRALQYVMQQLRKP